MKALLVIDVQQGMFALPDIQPHDGEGMVARISALLARARAEAIPVFFVQHDGGEGSPLSAEGSGFPFRAELAPLPSERVIVKRECNAFQNTALEEMLKAEGVGHLVICGMQSQYCVDTAVRAAYERGFKVTLVEDGHTTFGTPALSAEGIIAHENQTLGGGFAELCPARDVALA